MWVFIALFLVLIFFAINRFSKGDKIRRGKLTFTQSFVKSHVEQNEDIVLRTVYRNDTFTPVRKLYSVSFVDKNLMPEKDVGGIVEGKRNLYYKVSVPAKKSVTVDTKLKANRRGVYRRYGVNASVPDSFGYGEDFGSNADEGAIVVYPKRVDKRFLNSLVRQGFGDFNAKHGFLLDETSVQTYSTYTGREPMRSISWKKSAQSEDFMVKQYEPMGTHATIIIFDVGSGAINSIEEENYEYCVSMLREIFEFFEAKKISYRLYTNATAPMLLNGRFESYPSGKKTHAVMLDMLGRLNLKNVDKSLTGKKLLSEAMRENKGKPVVYLTDKQDASFQAQLKKLSKVRGLEFVSLYAEDYRRQE